jgi:hypothetical protein
VKSLRLVILFFSALLPYGYGHRLARQWDDEAERPWRNRTRLLEQLAHEINKQRQGGYWAQCGYHKKRERPLGRGGPVIVHERFKQRWVYR